MVYLDFVEFFIIKSRELGISSLLRLLLEILDSLNLLFDTLNSVSNLVFESLDSLFNFFNFDGIVSNLNILAGHVLKLLDVSS